MNLNIATNRCRNCVLPETKNHIEMNECGICNICQKTINKKLTQTFDNLSAEKKLEILKKKVDKYKEFAKHNNIKYDCAVSVSGGKDSIMTLYIAKKILGLNPLAIFIDNGFALEEMYQNVRNATDILQVDLVIYKTADLLKIFKECLKSNKRIYYCRVCHAVLDKTVREICKKYDIKLVLGGYTKGQQYIRNFELFWIYEESDRNILKIINANDDLKNLKELYSNQNDYFRNNFSDMILISPFKYIEWDEDKILEIITKELKFTLPKKSWPDKSSNCSFNYVAQYMALKQFGYAQHETELSDMIRAGEITRERALQIINTPIEDSDIKNALDKLGIDIKEIIG